LRQRYALDQVFACPPQSSAAMVNHSVLTSRFDGSPIRF
jgi:hypothetical protein